MQTLGAKGKKKRKQKTSLRCNRGEQKWCLFVRLFVCSFFFLVAFAGLWTFRESIVGSVQTVHLGQATAAPSTGPSNGPDMSASVLEGYPKEAAMPTVGAPHGLSNSQQPSVSHFQPQGRANNMADFQDVSEHRPSVTLLTVSAKETELERKEVEYSKINQTIS